MTGALMGVGEACITEKCVDVPSEEEEQESRGKVECSVTLLCCCSTWVRICGS